MSGTDASRNFFSSTWCWKGSAAICAQII
jgi:hypothetical protein